MPKITRHHTVSDLPPVLDESLLHKNPLGWIDGLLYLINCQVKENNADTKYFETLYDYFSKNIAGFRICLMAKIFKAVAKSKSKLSVYQHHTFIVDLLNCITTYHADLKIITPHLQDVLNTISSVLNDLRISIETKFSKISGIELSVPLTVVQQKKKEIADKLIQLKKRADEYWLQEPFSIVIKVLEWFVGKSHHFNCQQIDYYNDLMEIVAQTKEKEDKGSVFTELDKKLIGLNFNCDVYTEYLKELISRELQACTTIDEKRNKLLFVFKTFKQLCKKKKVSFCSNAQSVDNAICQ